MGNDVIYCVFLVLMASLAQVLGLRPSITGGAILGCTALALPQGNVVVFSALRRRCASCQGTQAIAREARLARKAGRPTEYDNIILKEH